MLEVQIYKKLAEFDLDISFQVNDNILGLMGASGSGKSMTLKCIAGIETPDQGRIVLNNCVLFDSEKKINVPIQKRNVGYMFQSYALFPNMNVYENISVGLRARKVKDVDIVVQKVMQQFRIFELASRYPKQLSGGQRQRVALARLIAYEPDVLLLDEPFSALDEDLKKDLLQELKSELQISKPVIFVSHDKEEVNYLCDLKYKIKQGEII
ncbi:sulfate/molybdate ABC transporter ATP-binding protein [Holdemanella biformis]|uniref:sulfate/molybdate ABC transporter ATP-binding protein n=1 Tax=Holdemanella biformis TaxID=1735 RepID=UPI002E779978|nr:ATP-binding cassette domain-containing protein [Holdemanella biformis]MEE0395922.1 ATP-binding cassette domain-containing protein [Holdemanella biformis]